MTARSVVMDAVSHDQVMHHVEWDQFVRFRRGVAWTPRSFRLTGVRWRDPWSLEFKMRGQTDEYLLVVTDPTGGSPEIRCSCPDSYRGLCKHMCWLVFKVLKHTDLDVFRTRRVPSALVASLVADDAARCRLVEEWGRSDGSSFEGSPDRELSFAAWTPKSCPFAVPGKWPLADADCPVCFDEMQEQNSSKQCPRCSNCFHGECIDTWFAHRQSCPLCRRTFAGS